MQKTPQRVKNFSQFTHFASIPFIRNEHRSILGFFQDQIEQIFSQNNLKHTIKRANTNLMHVTISMLTLNIQQYRNKTIQAFKELEKQIAELLKGVSFTLGDIKYFTKFDKKIKKQCVSLFYFELIQDENFKKLEKVTDLFIRKMIQTEIITSNQLKSMHIKYDHGLGKYFNEAYHITLFRIQNLEQNNHFKEIFKKVQQIKNEKQINIALQCDFVDISTRGNFDQTSFYTPLTRIPLRQIINKIEKSVEN